MEIVVLISERDTWTKYGSAAVSFNDILLFNGDN